MSIVRYPCHPHLDQFVNKEHFLAPFAVSPSFEEAQSELLIYLGG